MMVVKTFTKLNDTSYLRIQYTSLIDFNVFHQHITFLISKKKISRKKVRTRKNVSQPGEYLLIAGSNSVRFS